MSGQGHDVAWLGWIPCDEGHCQWCIDEAAHKAVADAVDAVLLRYPPRPYGDYAYEYIVERARQELEAREALPRPACKRLHIELAERDDGWVCHYCRTTLRCRCGEHSPEGQSPEVDHRHPRALGGADHPDNYVLACALCNGRKGAKPYDEFMAEVRP